MQVAATSTEGDRRLRGPFEVESGAVLACPYRVQNIRATMEQPQPRPRASMKGGPDGNRDVVVLTTGYDPTAERR